VGQTVTLVRQVDPSTPTQLFMLANLFKKKLTTRLPVCLLDYKQYYIQTKTTQRIYMSESDTDKVVVENLKVVGTRIAQLCSKNVKQTRLVAVSKTKPASLVKLCYDAGHRHFGENYVQELVEKAKQLPNDIRWHFIGHLQSNKCKQLLEVPSLWIVETVDSYKLAQVLDKTCTNAGRKDPLNIFVQVKTSPEQNLV